MANIFAMASIATTETDVIKTFGFGFVANAPEMSVIDPPLLICFDAHLITLNLPQKFISKSLLASSSDKSLNCFPVTNPLVITK